VKAFDRINVQNNPVNWVDSWGLSPAAIGMGSGASSSGFGAGAAGYSQGTLTPGQSAQMQDDLGRILELMDPRPLINDIGNLIDGSDDPCLTMGKGLGDKYGPLWDAPGMPGWNNPQNNDPHDPDWWKKPSNWEKMSKWQKTKWFLKKAAGALTGAGGAGI
jgi:hypothetical protein